MSARSVVSIGSNVIPLRTVIIIAAPQKAKGVLVTNHAIQIAVPESVHRHENTLVVSPSFEIRRGLWWVATSPIVN
eukprot:SAG25_NODE_93_length_16012_cov_22.660341_7_plen_76_part_00